MVKGNFGKTSKILEKLLPWLEKNKKLDVSLEWSILDKAKPYSPGLRNCMVYLTERRHIFFSGLNLLNKHKKLVSK